MASVRNQLMQQFAESRQNAVSYMSKADEVAEETKAYLTKNVAQISADLADGVISDIVEEKVAAYQKDLLAAHQNRKFDYVNMNPEEGLALDWETRWGNYERFTDDWLKNNNKGGLLSMARTKQAVKKYLANSATDISTNYLSQAWSEKVEKIASAREELTSEVFDEDKSETKIANMLASLDLSESDLYGVTAYGINSSYAKYEEEKKKYSNGESSDYYVSSMELAMSLTAYQQGWGEEEWARYKASDEWQSSLRNYKIIQSASQYGDIATTWKQNCTSTSTLQVGLQALLDDVGKTTEWVDQEGVHHTFLSNEERTLFISKRQEEIQKGWAAYTVEQNTLYTDLQKVIAEAETRAYNGEVGGRFFYSEQDEIDFKNSLKEFSGLSDEYIRASISADRKAVYTERTTVRSWASAVEVLNSPTSTAEQRSVAANTLVELQKGKLVAYRFNFGMSLESRDDDTPVTDSTVNDLFAYMKTTGGSLSDAVIARSFTLGDAVAEYNAGVNLTIDNLPDGFISGAVAFVGKGGKLEQYFKDSGMDITDPTSGDAIIYQVLTNAITLAGTDNGVDVIEKLYDDFIVLRNYKSKNDYNLTEEEIASSEYADKYASETERYNEAKKEIESFGYTLAYTSNKSTYQLGYLLKNSSLNGAYDSNVTEVMAQETLVSTLKKLIESGDKENLVKFVRTYGYDAIADEIDDMEDVSVISQYALAGNISEGYIQYHINAATEFEATGGYSSDYMTSKGSVGTIEDDIKTDVAQRYQDEVDSFLYMMMQNGKLTPGNSYNGLKLSDKAMNAISEGGYVYQQFASWLATANDSSSRASILSDAKKMLEPKVYEKLAGMSSINLKFATSGIKQLEGVTAEDLIKELSQGSALAKSMDNPAGSDFLTKLSESKSFNSRFDAITSNSSMSDLDKYNAITNLFYGEINSYVTTYIQDDINVTQREVERKYGVSAFSDLATISSEVESGKDTKDSSTNFFKSLNNNAATIKSSANTSDLLAQGYVEDIYNADSSNRREDITALLNLAMEMGSGTSAEYGKYAESVVYAALAYSVIKNTNLGLSATDFTSDNIENTYQSVSERIGAMSDTDKTTWYNTYGLLLGTSAVTSAHDRLGLNDTITYDNGKFVSDKWGDYVVSNDGTLLANVNGAGRNLGLFMPGQSASDIAKGIFGSASPNVTGTGATITASVYKDGGTAKLADYNKTNEELKGNDASAYNYAVIAYSPNLALSEKGVSASASGYRGAYSSNIVENSVKIDNVTIEKVGVLYDYYLDNGMEESATELLEQLSSKQSDAVLGMRQKTLDKREEERIKEEQRLASKLGGPTKTEKKSMLATFSEEHKNDNTTNANAIITFYEENKDNPLVAEHDIDKEALEDIWIFSKSPTQVKDMLEKHYGMK